MNLQKAIELNQETQRSLRDHNFVDHADAVKLGNKALKRILECQAHNCTLSDIELPGETDE